jgi:hypothetical protein
MRQLVCLLVLGVLLGGCGADPVTMTAVTVGTVAGTVAVIGRTPADAVVSLAKGKDCSAVRLEQGKTYCKEVEPPPPAQPYCTRSLGVVDCWASPVGQPPQVGDGPNTLTPAQEANRTRGWPF